jgi:hypothetical protein
VNTYFSSCSVAHPQHYTPLSSWLTQQKHRAQPRTFGIQPEIRHKTECR